MKCPSDMKWLRYEVKFAICASAHFIAEQLHTPSGVLHLPQANFIKKRRTSKRMSFFFSGAGDEARTRYLHLGKVALYRMSYTRIWGLFPRNMMHYSAGVPICQPLFSSFFNFYSGAPSVAG